VVIAWFHRLIEPGDQCERRVDSAASGRISNPNGSLPHYLN
jgi:hypothetical protein